MAGLTETQKNYLERILRGDSPEQIARDLEKSLANVKSVLNGAMNNMIAHDYETAAQKAQEQGLI